MKKFTIIQQSHALQVWTYEVEANSAEEAFDIIENGDAEPIDYEVIPADDGEGPLEVINSTEI